MKAVIHSPKTTVMKKAYTQKINFLFLALFLHASTFVKSQGPTICTDLPAPVGPMIRMSLGLATVCVDGVEGNVYI